VVLDDQRRLGAKKTQNGEKMKTMTKSVAALLVSATFMFGTWNSRAQNLLVDPGFELQTPPSAGGWNSFGGYFSTDYAHTGNWSMLDVTSYGVPGTFEQFPAAPGEKWEMTGYGLTPFPLLEQDIFGADFGIIQVTFFDIFGNNLGTVETAGSGTPAKVSNPVDSNATPGQWLSLDTGIATAPAGTAYIQAFTILVNFTGYPEGVYFDDLSLKVLVANHGSYVSAIAQNAQGLQNASLITAAQASAMVTQAAQTSGGK
jgi:hypothetical protein